MCLLENGPDKKLALIRHFFNLSTFSLHFIFVPWVAEKVVKTRGAGVSTWPFGWPCHTLSLGVSSLTGQSRVGIGLQNVKNVVGSRLQLES